jgi:hypothetical protein
MLFEHPPQNTLFACLLQGKSHYTTKLKTPSESVGPKSLPKKFLLQMDNCVKDNKNKYLLAFLLLLIAREVFEEVKLGFLVVGYTHEDIDGCFGYLSKKLKEQNNYILVDFMKAFMVLQERPFIMQFIQEIPDFKTWVFGCLKDGLETLVGILICIFLDFVWIHLASL